MEDTNDGGNANPEKAAAEKSTAEVKQESSYSSLPQPTPAQTAASAPFLEREGNEETSSNDHLEKPTSSSEVPDASNEIENANSYETGESEANGVSNDTENDADAATNEANNDATDMGADAEAESNNNSTTSDMNNANNMNPQQLQAINAYNNFMTQAAAAGAANNSQQYGMLNAPAPVPLVPDSSNAPLITTLLLSVANQQPGLVPQVSNHHHPAPPAPAATETAAAPPPAAISQQSQQDPGTQEPHATAAPVGAPAVAAAPANAAPTQAQAPYAPVPHVVPNMGLPFHPAANMLPWTFLLPQQMAMFAQQQGQQPPQGQPPQGQPLQGQQQQQMQQRFAFAPGATGAPVLTIPPGLQLNPMAANHFMAALQQQQQQQGQQPGQHQQQQQQAPLMNHQVQFMPSALPQTVLGTSSVFAPGSSNVPADSTGMMQAPGNNSSNGRTLPLYLEYDDRALTEYQCLLRQQIELFEATEEDVRGSAQGRHTRIRLGQAGIRCRHCAHLPKPARARGAVYYSKTIDGMYQVAQNMSKLHLIKQCHKVPLQVKNKLVHLQKSHTRASGGKEYWAEGLRVLGVIETDGMLKFKSSPEKQQQHGQMQAAVQQSANPTMQMQQQSQQQLVSAPAPPAATMPMVMEKPMTTDGGG
ncbi:unnamed protein product [Cylindrotheca closterium]|uniref:Uncharacterized protein n=1 Tax=Cylindrotheca closterium TaxID=2856 RepID=A0AAD2PXF2_9STRA|nr:unnamed protein product [Cylindrotheca closterium]